MKNSKIYILLIFILIGLSFPQLIMAEQTRQEKSCEESLKNVTKIKVGMKDSEILELLGAPTVITENNWSYNFFACTKPQIGAQVIVGVGIQFKEKVASEIGWATICAMGVKPLPSQKKKHS